MEGKWGIKTKELEKVRNKKRVEKIRIKTEEEILKG